MPHARCHSAVGRGLAASSAPWASRCHPLKQHATTTLRDWWSLNEFNGIRYQRVLDSSLQACGSFGGPHYDMHGSRVVTSTVAATGPAAEQWRSAAASAAAGDIAALRLLTMDIVLSPNDGQDRCGADPPHADALALRPRLGNEMRGPS